MITRQHTRHIASPRRARLSDWAVFFDFDNTVTSCDVLDELIRRFSINRNWLPLQRAWEAGRIGSKACLEGQLQSVRITRAALSDYLASIPLDPHFKRLAAFLRRHGAQLVIVSDNFTPLITSVLRRHRVRGVPIRANRLRFAQNTPIPVFEAPARRCARGCAHCKKPHLLHQRIRGKRIMYIGDGLSDRCPAEAADLVFAKGALRAHLHSAKQPYVAFGHLKEVYDHMKAFNP